MSRRIVMCLGLVAALGGCSSSLETGYVPRKLGASDTERRAYYADPYSPAQREANQEREAEMRSRRPTF